MRLLYQLIVILFLAINNSIAQNDYILQIGDQTIEIGLDSPYQVEIDGIILPIRLSSKDTLLYRDPLFSFQYPKEYRVSELEIGEGINQIMLMTAEGSGILIQKYETLDPSSLTELMLNEVTKESLSYGFTMEQSQYCRDLISGQQLQIAKATLRYKNEKNIYEVAALGSNDQGILVVTMIMDEEISHNGRQLIDMMWQSLALK